MTCVKTRKQRALTVGVLSFLLLAGAGLLLLLRPPCLIRSVFGVECPACGTTRMVLALLRLDVSAALQENPFMLFFLPAAGVWFVVEAVRYIQGRPLLLTKRWAAVFWLVALCIGLAFAVWRNLV